MAHALLHHSVTRPEVLKHPSSTLITLFAPIKRCRRILRRTVGGYVTGYLIHYVNIVPLYRIH